jgi:transcriptional regulator with PAS, ATPase and Fis domain
MIRQNYYFNCSPEYIYSIDRQVWTKSIEKFIQDVEKKLIRRTLHKTNNNQNRAADFLGISSRSLRYRINKHGIKM